MHKVESVATLEVDLFDQGVEPIVEQTACDSKSCKQEVVNMSVQHGNGDIVDGIVVEPAFKHTLAKAEANENVAQVDIPCSAGITSSVYRTNKPPNPFFYSCGSFFAKNEKSKNLY